MMATPSKRCDMLSSCFFPVEAKSNDDFFSRDMMDRVLDILDSAEEIISQDDALFEPTPIGPNGVQSLVPEVPVSSHVWNSDQSFTDLFQTLGASPLNDNNSYEQDDHFKNHSLPPTKRQCLGFTAKDGTSSCIKMPAAAASVEKKEYTKNNRYRQYQADQWNERFQDLVDFRRQYGHCLVPHNYPVNQQLAQWVKTHRYQYKLMQMGHHSMLTQVRKVALEDMGFVWDSHKAAWIERYESLKQFKYGQGHCDVPSNYSDRALAIWAKCQRRQYKLYTKGDRSTMTNERSGQLEGLGFDWNPRN
jgi:hypothetical protein